MAVPNYQTNMLPLLEFAGDQQDHLLRESIDNLAGYFNLTEITRKIKSLALHFSSGSLRSRYFRHLYFIYRIQASGKGGDDAKHYQIKAVKAVIEASRR